jgi:hypothetical protein
LAIFGDRKAPAAPLAPSPTSENLSIKSEFLLKKER